MEMNTVTGFASRRKAEYYVSDGHTTEWLGNIQRLRHELETASMLYPGHGTPGRSELFDWQEQYLETYRAEVATLLKGKAGTSRSPKTPSAH